MCKCYSSSFHIASSSWDSVSSVKVILGCLSLFTRLFLPDRNHRIEVPRAVVEKQLV